MKKLFAALLVLSLILNITGCAGIQKKFTRKKKEAVKMPRVHQVKKFEKKPTPELYKKHFSYWSTWQSELLQVLGQNHKKDVRCIEEIMSNLNDIENLLVKEKADKLAPHIERMAKVRDIILKEEMSQYNKEYVRQTLDREGRYIKREFIYKKVENYLKKSFEDESRSSSE